MLSARTIVPENIRIMRKRIVIVVLVLLGALVALILFRSLFNNEPQYRGKRLSELGPVARLALPDLVELVKRDDSDLRAVHAVCRTLGDFGNEGANAIPALNARLKKEPRPTSRINFAKTLCQIDAQQTEALGVILNHAKSQGDANRVYALMSLGNIGPNAKAAVPILIEAATEDDAQIWNPAATALLKIGETNLAFSAVADRLKHNNKQTRLGAAMFIVYYEPTNLVAISNLVEFAQDSSWGRVAISELAKLRPVPQSAVLTLREIAASKDN